MNIIDFYKNNSLDKDFDDIFYSNKYPEVNKFYQPFCSDNSIDDKHRLYYHYMMYGINYKYRKNLDDFLKYSLTQISTNKLDSGIEEFWPPHPKHYDSYVNNALSGESICKTANIAVVGLARNCEKNLKKNIDSILSLNCNEIKFFIYENDSIDNTKQILKDASQNNNNFFISLNSDFSEYLKDRSQIRTDNLARYRNACLEWVKNNCGSYDYTIVLDLDADLGFSIEGIYNSIYWLSNISNAGGMASYSLYLKMHEYEVKFAHYDSFAVRLNNWDSTQNNIDDNNTWFCNLHPPVGSDPILMYSCFGGLCVYKNDAFLNGTYDGSLGSEHVFFHKTLKNCGYDLYLNPSSRFFSVFDFDIKK